MNWIYENKEWLLSGIGISFMTLIGALFKKPFLQMIKKITAVNLFINRQDIVLKISDGFDQSPFSFVSISVSSIYEAKLRIENGGKIIIKCKEYKRIKRMIKKLKDDDEKMKIGRYKNDIDKKIDNIAKYLEVGIKDSLINRYISSFLDYVEGVISLEFWTLRTCTKKDTEDRTNVVKLDIYNYNQSIKFSIYIPRMKYDQVLNETDEKILVPYMVSLNEIFNDNSIFNCTILPEYSRALYMLNTQTKGKYITEDISLMNISVA